MRFLDVFKKEVQVVVIAEPVPNFDKEMVIIETSDEDEDEENSKN